MTIIDLIKQHWLTLSGIAGAAWATWKGIVWYWEWNGPLDRLKRTESTLKRHLDECSEANRVHTDKLDDVADQVSKLTGMIEIIRDRLD